MAHTQSPHSLTLTHFLLDFGASPYRKKGKRQIAAKKLASLLQVARLQLHLSALPKCSSLGQSPSLTMYSRLCHSFLSSNFSSLVFILSFFLFLLGGFCFEKSWEIFVCLFVCLFVWTVSASKPSQLLD